MSRWRKCRVDGAHAKVASNDYAEVAAGSCTGRRRKCRVDGNHAHVDSENTKSLPVMQKSMLRMQG